MGAWFAGMGAAGMPGEGVGNVLPLKDRKGTALTVLPPSWPCWGSEQSAQGINRRGAFSRPVPFGPLACMALHAPPIRRGLGWLCAGGGALGGDRQQAQETGQLAKARTGCLLALGEALRSPAGSWLQRLLSLLAANKLAAEPGPACQREPAPAIT